MSEWTDMVPIELSRDSAVYGDELQLAYSPTLIHTTTVMLSELADEGLLDWVSVEAIDCE